MALLAYSPGSIEWPYLDKDSAEWLRNRYELSHRIPLCWFKHGPVAED